jgi:hypothetical protein
MISFPHSVSAGSTANLATARVPPPPGTWIGMSIGSLGFGSHGGESGRLLARRIGGMSNFGGIDLSR